MRQKRPSEYTSLDGELTIWDCFPSWWLMFIRSQVGDGKHKGPPYLKELALLWQINGLVSFAVEDFAL